MENFILIGIFVGLGILFRRIEAFPEQTAQVLNIFALYVALPAVILLKIPQLKFSGDMIIPAVIPWMMLLLSAALILIVGKCLRWSRETIAVLLLVVPIGNTSFMGVPMVKAFFGETGIPFLIIYDQIGTMIIFAIFGSVILAMHSCEGKVNIAGVAKRAILFPPTLALLIGLLLRAWPYPDAMVRGLETLAGMLTPLVMTAIGFQLNIRLSPTVLRPLGFGLAVKLAIAPLAALIACYWLELNGLATEVSVFEAGMPPMVTAGALAIAAGILPELAAALVSVGMALAFVTLPVLYWII
ncbi:AEC family transporter [Malonomonas rubra]|uniref:AEC family transporter n=1 Tax=Malonomonas rubra TaxID=57040 RepID=UPI0026E99091|nr:AEC family transporter [Malonomonas rubra]